jgi:hypothetical protein
VLLRQQKALPERQLVRVNGRSEGRSHPQRAWPSTPAQPPVIPVRIALSARPSEARTGRVSVSVAIRNLLPLGAVQTGERLGLRVIAGGAPSHHRALQPLTKGLGVLLGQQEIGHLFVAGVKPRRIGVEPHRNVLQRRQERRILHVRRTLIPELSQDEVHILPGYGEPRDAGHNPQPPAADCTQGRAGCPWVISAALVIVLCLGDRLFVVGVNR